MNIFKKYISANEWENVRWLNRKMNKKFEYVLYEKSIQNADNHIQTCAAWPMIREMKIKVTWGTAIYLLEGLKLKTIFERKKIIQVIIQSGKQKEFSSTTSGGSKMEESL